MTLIFVRRRQAPRAGERLLSESSKLTEYIDQLRSNLERNKYERTLRVSRSYHFGEIRDLDSDWYKALREQFNDRCAYCESYVGSNGNAEHFRPVNGVKDSHIDQIDPDYYGDFHYIWLAYQWSNLILSCPDCNYNKGNYFPVHGKRAMLFAGIRHESHLIIDPCKDNPEEHLYYDSEGLLVAKSRKGNTTIDLLDLNRWQLVSDRKKQMFNFLGIDEYQIIRAQGTAIRNREEILEKAYKEADEATKHLSLQQGHKSLTGT